MKTISRFIALKIVCGFLIFAFGGATFADDLSSGLVAYYPFNGNANDESGSGNHGTVYGASLTTDRFGNPNSAYSFDGVSDYIATNYSGILGGAPRTISLWLKTTINNKTMYGLAYGGHGDGRGNTFRCGLNSIDGTEGTVIDVSNGEILYNANIDDNNWHHYVWVVPDMEDPRLTDVKVYQDGQLLPLAIYHYRGEAWSQQTVINTTQLYNVHIGHFYDSVNPDFYYSGDIDDVSIYNRALSETEIQALFTGGLLCSCPTDGCLKGCISGLVEDADTGQPLAGKLVKLKRIFPKGSGMTLMNVVTDTGGCYSFSNLDDGTYRITVKGCKGGGKKVVVISGSSKEEGKNFQCK